MGFSGYKFSDKEVVRWAKIYRTKEITLQEMESAFGISHSTIWWAFQNRLALIDVNLYDQVLESLDYNKRNRLAYRRENGND